jgi:hypothetical protein
MSRSRSAQEGKCRGTNVGLPAFYLHPKNPKKELEILNYRKKIFNNRKKNSHTRAVWRSLNLCEDEGLDAKEELMEFIRKPAADMRLTLAKVLKDIPHLDEHIRGDIASLVSESVSRASSKKRKKKKKKRRKQTKAQKKAAKKKAQKTQKARSRSRRSV